MNCLNPASASEFVEGVVEDALRSSIEEHVADCGECRKLLVAIAGTNESGGVEGFTRSLEMGVAFLGPGAEIGRFIIRESLGRGGMGVVYRARDPELNRDVAIKLLHFDREETRSQEGEARLVREAQAMAQLSHPNVVTVYEVGTQDGYVFIAMELLAGQTLNHWLASATRSTAEIVDAFIGAGQGLHAAHQAGLVHRDFKPANVIVDDTGRAVVLDFGLVAGEEYSTGELTEEVVEQPLALTRTGALLGTPAYMAPEQYLGEAIGPRTDQWAFAVCLFQAFVGQHPFTGPDLNSLRGKVLSGKLPDFPQKIPTRVRHVIARGLSLKKEERFDSMVDMVQSLEGKKRKPWAWVAAAAVIVGAISAMLMLRQPKPDLCTGGKQTVDMLWTSQLRGEILASFGATKLPFAAATADIVVKELGNHLDQWATVHRQTCEATQVRKELGQDAMDMSMACLDRRLRETKALISQLRQADRGMVAGAETALRSLSDLQSCQNQSRLAAIIPEPTDPQSQVVLAELRDELAEVKALLDLGHPSKSYEKLQGLQERVKDLGYPVATAEFEYWHGRTLSSIGRHPEAESAYAQSAYAALGAADDRRLVLSATSMVSAIGTHGADAKKGEVWHQFARAALIRSGANPRLTRELEFAHAELLAGSGEFEEAQEIAKSVLEQLIAQHGETDHRVASAHQALGSFYDDAYKHELAQPHLQKALDIWTAHHGPEHPTVAIVLAALGAVSAKKGEYEQALSFHRRALTIAENALGPDHPTVGTIQHAMCWPLTASGKPLDGLAACQRALDITRMHYGLAHPRNASTLYTMGYIYWSLGRFEEAYQSHSDALKLRIVAFGADHAWVADIHIELGRTSVSQDHLAKAVEHYGKAVEIRRTKVGSAHDLTILTLTDLGGVYVAMGEHLQGLPILEEANNHWKTHKVTNAQMSALNSFFLAQALWESGGQKDRARTLAQASLATFRTNKAESNIKEVTSWLAAH